MLPPHDKVASFLMERPSRNAEEDFNGGDFLFLHDCFDNVKFEGFGVSLLTNPEIDLNDKSYITTEKASEIIGKSVSVVRLWGYRNGVEAIRTEDGIKRLVWSEEDIERYKNAIHTPRGFKGHKHSEETKKHFSEIRKGKNSKVLKKLT